MAVEIRELVIKALIVNDQSDKNSLLQESYTGMQKDKLVQECVNQVLKIIKKGKNR